MTKVGRLHGARLLTIFGTHVLSGHLEDGTHFVDELRCLDGDASRPHWVHTNEGRVRLTPEEREHLFDDAEAASWRELAAFWETGKWPCLT